MRLSTGLDDDASPAAAWLVRHFRAAAVLVLALAAFNLFFRLDREVVTEWDESLYATSAAEAAFHGTWVGTTFLGSLDYYNTKPPLNVWLIAASFKLFGPSVLSLRLVSALAAWTTVLVLMLWARRVFGAPTALLSALVLAATFGFLYVHSGRSANTDALFTLLMLLAVVTLWLAEHRPWRLAWLGPIVGAVFLLRGMAALMPLAMIVTVVVLGGRRLRERAAPLAVASLLTIVPAAAWGVARWRVDRWEFLSRMFHRDFVARSASVLDGHTGSLLYYPNVLQKDQYEWLLAAVAALVLCRIPWLKIREALTETDRNRYVRVVAGAWLGVTLAIPTLMQTKVAWYLNPFFPLFAVATGRILAHAFVHPGCG